MRSPTTLAATLGVIAVAACSSGSPSATTDAALARDIQLASTATLALPPSPASDLSAMETMPLHAATPATRPRAERSTGRSAVRRASSPRATAQPAVAEEPQEAVAAAPSVEQAGSAVDEVLAAVAAAEGGVALPRPVPVSVGLPPAGGAESDDGYSRGRRGSVIRGGDIDDCRIHDRRPRRPVHRPPTRSDEPGGGRWGDVARRPEGPRTGGGDVVRRPETTRSRGTEGQRGGLWGRTPRGQQ